MLASQLFITHKLLLLRLLSAMSEWSTSLGYSTSDFFPGSDDEEEVVQAPLQQVRDILAIFTLPHLSRRGRN